MCQTLKGFDEYFVYRGEDWRGQTEGGWIKDIQPDEVKIFIKTLISQEVSKAREEERKSKSLQGWECPKCGSVYAIWVTDCWGCRNSNIKVTTSSGTTSDIKPCPNCKQWHIGYKCNI